MISVLKSSAIGAATSILTWAAAWLLLVVLATVNGAPSHTVRQIIAIAGLGVVAAGGVFVVVGVPFALGPRLRANPWVALVVAGVVTGLTAHWFLLYVSIVNDCASRVSVPYNWIHTCSRSQ